MFLEILENILLVIVSIVMCGASICIIIAAYGKSKDKYNKHHGIIEEEMN